MWFFSQGGMYILQLMDHYVASWSLLIVGLTEVLVISYVYGQYRPYIIVIILLEDTSTKCQLYITIYEC